MNKNTYPQAVDNFPLTKELDNICAGLKASKSRSLVLTADTGSGKSTVLPLGLLNHFNGKLLMLEPRRLAVLNIVNRVSELLDEPVGNTCGYSIHLESKGSEKTRFTVVTEAVLIRRLQQDPELTGVSVVVLDEFHERSIHADLALNESALLIYMNCCRKIVMGFKIHSLVSQLFCLIFYLGNQLVAKPSPFDSIRKIEFLKFTAILEKLKLRKPYATYKLIAVIGHNIVIAPRRDRQIEIA